MLIPSVAPEAETSKDATHTLHIVFFPPPLKRQFPPSHLPRMVFHSLHSSWTDDTHSMPPHSMRSLPPTGTWEGSSTRDRGGRRAPKAPCVFIGALSPLWSFLPSIPLLLLNFHCVFKYSLCTRPSCSYAGGVIMSKVLTVWCNGGEWQGSRSLDLMEN